MNSETKEIKYLKYAIIFIGVVGLIVFIIQGEKGDKLADRKYHELAIEGVVQEIKYFENEHGLPSFYINGTWYNFYFHGHRITPFLKQNDSLVKTSGSDTIRIYRQNELGDWVFIKAI